MGKAIVTKTFSKAGRIVSSAFEQIIAIFAKIREGAKNIKPFLDEILEWLRKFLSEALATFKEATRAVFAKHGITIKEVPQSKLLFANVPIKVEKSIYALIKDGKEIFRGTKKEVEALAKKLDELGEEAGKKYLDYLKILPKNCEIVFDKGVYKFIDKSTNELVGFVELIDRKLGLAIYREGLETKISGQQVFNSLIENLKINKVEYDGILGIWGRDSTNTSAFNEAISEGLSLEKAAFKTWTGQRAIEQGFKEVKVLVLEPQKPPYSKINVEFYN